MSRVSQFKETNGYTNVLCPIAVTDKVVAHLKTLNPVPFYYKVKQYGKLTGFTVKMRICAIKPIYNSIINI